MQNQQQIEANAGWSGRVQRAEHGHRVSWFTGHAPPEVDPVVSVGSSATLLE